MKIAQSTIHRPVTVMMTFVGLAREYVEIGLTMLRETKALLYQNCVEQDIALVTQREGEAIARCTGTPEQREAASAKNSHWVNDTVR